MGCGGLHLIFRFWIVEYADWNLQILCDVQMLTCESCAAAVIWDALKAAAEADLATAQLICDSAGIIISSSDMTTCYDERGTMAFPSSSFISGPKWRVL